MRGAKHTPEKTVRDLMFEARPSQSNVCLSPAEERLSHEL